MEDLTERHCVSFTGDEDPLDADDVQRLLERLGKGWTVVENHHIEKEYSLGDFREALEFVNEIGEIAEEEDHHPDLELGWGRVAVQLRTHKIDGLSVNDFILAARADEAFQDF